MLDPALPFVALFHVNLEEAASLTGHVDALIERARAHSSTASPEDVVTPDELRSIATSLLALGPAAVVHLLRAVPVCVWVGGCARVCVWSE
jgi:hypothetical protein